MKGRADRRRCLGLALGLGAQATGAGLWGADPVRAQGTAAGGPEPSPVALTPRPASAHDWQLWGYYPWWMREYGLGHDLSVYHRLKFFEIEIGEDGGLKDLNGWPRRWDTLARAARARGQRIDVTVTLFEPRRFEQLFTRADRRERLLAELVALARTADGLHLDVEMFEAVSPEAVAGYRAVCAALRAALGSGRLLSAFGVVGAAAELYDKATLDLLDVLVVQGYDAHTAAGRQAGPVAPLRGPYAVTWEQALRHYLQLGMPRRRLLFGLPFFGYEWPTASGEIGAATTGKGLQTTYGTVDVRLLPNVRTSARAQAALHGLRRDPVSGSPYYVFREPGGGWRQGWFEDETSLAGKIAWAQREGVAGVAVFPIGYDQGAFDPLLQRSFRGR